MKPGLLGFFRFHEHGRRTRAAIAAVCMSLTLSACAGTPKPAEVCLELEASENLNRFDGQPHVVVLLFFPLQNVSAFNQTDPVDLLNGVQPPGSTGDAWEVTLLPGETRNLEEKLPADTGFVGLVADFYRGPSRTVVEASCGSLGLGGTKIVLSSNDLQVE